MISRIWHGWTTPENADVYEAIVRTEVIPGIIAKRVTGLLRIELFRRDGQSEIEFVTIMWFDTIDAVKGFAGADYQAAYVPERARQVLSRFDERSTHYDVLENQKGG